VSIEVDHGIWYQLGTGRGRLRCRLATVSVRGRGAAVRARQAPMWLPTLTCTLPMIAEQSALETNAMTEVRERSVLGPRAI